jgi:hypothetical protein
VVPFFISMMDWAVWTNPPGFDQSAGLPIGTPAPAGAPKGRGPGWPESIPPSKETSGRVDHQLRFRGDELRI